MQTQILNRPKCNQIVARTRFRPADVARFTGFTVEQLRDLRKRGYGESTGGKWLDADITDIARLFFVKLLRNNNVELAKAWKLASDETIGAIVVRAAMEPGAFQDHSGKIIESKTLAFELVGTNHVGGPLFIWGPTIEANTYSSPQNARQLAESRGLCKPHIMTIIDLTELGEILNERIGEPIATVEVD